MDPPAPLISAADEDEAADAGREEGAATAESENSFATICFILRENSATFRIASAAVSVSTHDEESKRSACRVGALNIILCIADILRAVS